MRISHTPAKNDKNIQERGLAKLRGRLHPVVITRRGDATHATLFRKANQKAVKWYEHERK